MNTNILSRADALELFVKDGWNEIVMENTDYDKFLEVVRNLGDYDFVSDMHVKNLFVFPPSSKQYWAKHASGNEKKFILQDKVRRIFICMHVVANYFLCTLSGPKMQTSNRISKVRGHI